MSPIALVLGAGANIGQAVGRKFAANGYKVALASRTSSGATSQDAKDGLFHFRVDLTDPTNVKTLFEQVQASLGVPNVVIYNGLSYPPLLVEEVYVNASSMTLQPAIQSAEKTPSQSPPKTSR